MGFDVTSLGLSINMFLEIFKELGNCIKKIVKAWWKYQEIFNSFRNLRKNSKVFEWGPTSSNLAIPKSWNKETCTVIMNFSRTFSKEGGLYIQLYSRKKVSKSVHSPNDLLSWINYGHGKRPAKKKRWILESLDYKSNNDS